MSALGAARINFMNKSTLGRKLGRPAQTAKTFWNGAMVALDATGYLVPNTGTAGEKIRGCVDLKNHPSILTTGAAGASTLEVIDGIFPFAIGTSTDVLTQADVGNDVFGIDDQTVGRTDGGTGRPIAGELVALETIAGVALAWVGIGVNFARSARNESGSVEGPIASGALSTDTDVSELTVTGTVAFAIASPLYVGQRKVITTVALGGSPVATLTSTASHGWTTVSGLGALGRNVNLVCVLNGSTLVWDIAGGLGVTVA